MRDEVWGALLLTGLTYMGYVLSKLVYAVVEVLFQ